MKQQFLNELNYAAIAFAIIMLVVLWQIFMPHSWLRRRYTTVTWHKQNWHWERHEFCDGLGVLWLHDGRWQAIPPNLRTNYPSLGNTKKCSCKMGRMAVLNEQSDMDLLKLKKKWDLK
jgi:hypothetical protein